MKSIFYHLYIGSRILLLSVVCTFLSCSDFLEEQPSTLIDSDYIFTTEDGLESGVVSLYKLERDRYQTGTEDYMGAVLMSSRSDLAFSRTGYTGLMGRYQRGVSPDDFGATLASTLFWRNYYNIANKSTELINSAEVIEGIDEDVRIRVLAEAKFFRAHAYFYLYRMYNNIYVSDGTITVDNAFDVIDTRSSDEEIFSLINSDLDYAVEHLPWTNTFGRLTKGTAHHVKAKVAMWQGEWNIAEQHALSVIEGADSPHSLVSSTSDVFSGDRDHSESLFVLQAQDDLLGGGGTTMMNANYVTQYFQIGGIESNIEQGGRGFSRILPNLYLQGLLNDDPNDTRNDNTYFRLEYFYTSGDRIGEKVDDYAPITDLDNPSDNYTRFYQRMHPSCIKFAQEDDNPNSYLNRSNILVYRLAETYLIAAEAMMRQGKDGTSYLNAVRMRAGAAPVTSIDEQTVLDERARELAFEGQRWFTLKRMGQDVIDRQITSYAGDGEYFPANLGAKDPRSNWRSHYINWPIAQRDLDLLGASYPQNDGY